MNIVKISEQAVFVPSYSEQTITCSYSTVTTLGAFGSQIVIDEKQSDKIVPENQPFLER